MVEHVGRHPVGSGDARQQLRTRDRVMLDDATVVPVQETILEEHGVRDADLPDVVQQRGMLDVLDVVQGNVQREGELPAISGDPPGMSGRIGIAQVDRLGQHREGRPHQ